MRTRELLIPQEWSNPIERPAVIRTPENLPDYSNRELQGIDQGLKRAESRLIPSIHGPLPQPCYLECLAIETLEYEPDSPFCCN